MAERPRDLDAFSINVQRYSQNNAQNCIFGPRYGGIRVNISALFKSKVLMQRNFEAELHRTNVRFTRKTAN